MAFTRLSHRLGQLDEAFVEAEIVANRVLPALVLALEEGEVGLQVLVDLVERHLFGVRVLNRHDDERYVGKWRLLVLLFARLERTAFSPTSTGPPFFAIFVFVFTVRIVVLAIVFFVVLPVSVRHGA